MRRPFALLLLLALTPSIRAEDFTAKVVGVSDGDTLTVLRDGRTQVKVRLWGVDAPETGQPFGSKAKQATSGMVFGEDGKGVAVTVKVRDKDRYGRTVAEVILPDGKNLNHELVGRGMAWWYRDYAKGDVELARLETEARAAKRGLWSDPKPTPPWEWRNPKAGQVVAAGFVASRNSDVYHRPNCRNAARIKESNRIEFRTEAEAEKAGYRKAVDCR